MDTRQEILQALRASMKEKGLDALFIPSTDPHLGEYVPAHWKIIEWLTGFTGSAANVIICADFAGLWTDSRYFIQAENQLADSGYQLVRLQIPHTPEYIDWISENLHDKAVLGVDGGTISIGIFRRMIESFKKKGIEIDISQDLITQFWVNRPGMHADPGFEHQIKFAGESLKEKIARVRIKMSEMGVQYHLLTALDDIAWLLNIRGSDVKYSPLLTSYVIICPDQILLFVDESKVPGMLKVQFDRVEIVILPYEEIVSILQSLEPDLTMLINPGTCSAKIYNSIPDKAIVIEDISIPTRMKAIKNSIEQDNIRKVMIRDGVALTKLFFWLENSIGKERISEISAAEKLLAYRMEQENFAGESFATIAAYNSHGALPHYCASPDTDVELKPEGIFLLDSGGQYYDGTTDITRTIALGEPTSRQMSDFTLALKGTINLAMARFPFGTKGFQLEILARKALWEHGLNYGHGTGHGVGAYLNVHEGPQTIGTGASGDLTTIIEPGMLTSDEPAIYRDGEYGFRTENLILCIADRETPYGKFLKFETVTLCYIDQKLIDITLLLPCEIEWLNSYHREVYEKLSPFLSEEEKGWLKVKTEDLNRVIRVC